MEKFPAATAEIMQVAFLEDIVKQENTPYPPRSIKSVFTWENPDPVTVIELGVPSLMIEGFKDCKEIGSFKFKTANPDAKTL
jgi:hypothetical protein